MASCKKCGAHIPDGEIFCSTCKNGFKNGAGNAAKGIFDFFGNTDDFSNAYSAKDISDNRLYALLCYIPILCLYPIIFKTRSSGYVRFHANGGLMLFLCEILISALIYGIGLIPVAGRILSFPIAVCSGVLDLAFLVLTVYGAALAWMGKAKELPLIGKIKIFK